MKQTIFRLLKEIKPHSKKVFVIAITGILYSVCYTRLILLIKDISNSFESGKQDQVAHTAVIAVALSLVVAISRYFHIFLMNYVAEIVSNNYRLQLQKKFMSLNLTFHSNYNAGSGGLLSRILNDIRVIQDGLRMVADFFREPLLLIFLLGNLFYLNWRLTAMVLVLLPFILLFLRQISKSLRKYVLWGQENLEKMTSTIKESLDGVRIIQSFNLENILQDKLKAESGEYLGLRKKVHARIEVMGPVTEFIATLLVLSIFMYFSIEISKGNITTGDVLAYIASLLTVNQPIKKLQESYVRIQETVVACDRVFQVLDEKSEVPQDESLQPFPESWQRIVYKDVSFRYHDEWVLKNINLEIKRGESIAFVGGSGSGKSTLVNLLERFYDPTSGEIYIDNIPIRKIQLKELRKHIALVTQDVFLFSDTIGNNIWSGDFQNEKTNITNVAKSANAHDFIMKTPKQYQSKVGDRGNLLSGGEKQRISLARAFFKDAPILILDEATSALDSSSELEVQKGIDQLMHGRTSLVIAHRLSTIQNVDKIYVLKSGEVIETGQHNDLIQKHGEYYKFYNQQTRGV